MASNPYNKKALLGELGVEEPQQPDPVGPTIESPSAPAAAPAAPSPFQSQNQSVRGYLDEAVRFNAGNIKGIGDEAGRKAANESFLTSLIPEIQKRGGSISDIRGDKARVDGRMIDFYRDIEVAADPQYLDVTDDAAKGAFAGEGIPGLAGIQSAQSGISDLLQGDPQAAIQEALAKLTQGGTAPNLQALLAQLGGV